MKAVDTNVLLRLFVNDDKAQAAKARALLDQRDHVAPDDIQAILPQTVAHRLVPVAGAGRGRVEQVRAMIAAVPLP